MCTLCGPKRRRQKHEEFCIIPLVLLGAQAALPCPALQQGTVTGAAAGPVCLAALLTHHSLLDLGVLQRETNGFLKNLIQGSSFKFFFCLSQLQQILLKVAAEPDGKATY